MDIQEIVDKVSEAVKDAPEKLGEVTQDPKGAIEAIIGEPIEDIDPTQILEGVKENVSNIDFGAIAQDLPGQLGNVAGQAADFIGGLFGKKGE